MIFQSVGHTISWCYIPFSFSFHVAMNVFSIINVAISIISKQLHFDRRVTTCHFFCLSFSSLDSRGKHGGEHVSFPTQFKTFFNSWFFCLIGLFASTLPSFFHSFLHVASKQLHIYQRIWTHHLLYLSSFLDFGGKCGREQGESVFHLELNLELFSIFVCLLDKFVCFCTTFFYLFFCLLRFF